MFLKAKKVNISTGGPLVALLNEKDASLLDLNPLDRIELKAGKRKLIVAVDITDKEIKKFLTGTFIFDKVFDSQLILSLIC